MKKTWIFVGMLFTLSIGWTVVDVVSFVSNMEEAKKADKKMAVLKKELKQRKDLLDNLETDPFVKKTWHPNVVAKRKFFLKKEIAEFEAELQDLQKRREIKENPPVLIDLPPEVLAAGY